ncbi:MULTISPECIES: UxaA family hydrolase [Desulfitobacterium]|uniref:Altronate dehydratase n=1 Tax=Desulfitobacterium dehalogenans (strain ATCC 51507 / DSM 9161 / JW/IU-DC1) TaxID=756499 RepID=I4AAR6_DESDJ|nr:MULTISPECIES: UxaA family hydrolase [Desulfitobacterium]AFM01051.1 altronate dehydratase [Desulfitobacterium dehalogenans ATCC 51507]
MNIFGFRRPDGLFGIRNHLLILPTSVCATTVAFNIAAQIPGAIAIPNQHGCCQLGADFEQTLRTLIGIGKNPNVGAVLVVGLGCEGIPIQHTAEEIAKSGKPVQTLIIQENSGTLKTTSLGIQIAGQMARTLSMLKGEEAPISELSLGIECGGSDFTSGLASNPAVGTASDLMVKAGGTAMLSETTEFIGAEHVLAKRAKSPEVAEKLIRIVKEAELRAKQLHVDLRDGQPTPGNIAGGISSIEEKSLGCIYKAGHSTIQDVLAYGESPQGKGLYVMDTPGQDVESMIGMLAGGVQLIVFTTGRGTPTGSPIAPVIKVTANSDTYVTMEDNIDLDLSSIISGEATIEDSGRRIFEEMLEVARGKLTKSESLGHREFGIFRIGSTF